MMSRLFVFFALAFLPLAASAQSRITKNPNAIEGAGPRNVYDKELLYQVRFGQLKDIQMLLQKGANPSQINEIGWPLVSVAASRHDLAVPILRELIKADADINQGGPSNMYPVVVAARNGDRVLMHFLLKEALADFDKRDPNGVTVHDIAVEGGYTDMVAEIEEIQQQRDETKARMVSPERRDQLVHDLLVDSCELEYVSYYNESKQERLTKEQMDDSLSEAKGHLSVATNDLVQIFSYPLPQINQLSSLATTEIFNQLEALISNRNRRAHGVGAEGDMEKRCEAVAQDITDSSLKPQPKKGRRQGTVGARY